MVFDSQTFDRLANPDLWIDVAAIGGGYLGASVVQVALEGNLPFDLPNEAYGLIVAYGGYTADMKHSSKLGTGGALYAFDAFAQRVGMKGAVTSMAGQAASAAGS